MWIELPAVDERELAAQLRGGASYFDVPHGGSVEVLRLVSDPGIESGIPVERWNAGEIAGLPAAIGRPILDGGFGDSEVIVYHDGVLTIVRGVNLSLQEMIRIAEGLMQ